MLPVGAASVIIWEVTVADEEVARYSAQLDGLDRTAGSARSESRRAGAVARASAVSEALRPVVPIAIKLGAGQVPGAGADEDAGWAAMTALARREVLARRTAGHDCGLAAASLRLLDRVDQLACARTDPAWQQCARERVGDLVDARRRGDERGRRLREPHTANRPHPAPPSGGWWLRHPDDHWLRYALAAEIDERCRHLIEALQAGVRPAYQRLSDLDWTACEAAAEVICTVEIRTSQIGASQAPETAIVTDPVLGDVEKEQLVSLAMVEHPDQPFNGKLISVLVGDRWRLCARRAGGDVLVALDGSRRLSL